ncbi:MAG TPA: thiamine pyrophosphate-dependent enzyme [Oculatellaceae cyanobacterium]
MAKVKLADYLFGRLKELGVDTTFGIPGDFVLPLYAAQERCGLKTIVMTHEPSVGFAADAYARLRGLGVGLVTYGAGGLNMINSVALAYAEESPLLIISGSPETRFRSQPAMLHHCVKEFDTQYNVFAEVTAAQALLDNPKTAQEQIELVLETILKSSRPGYIEIPRDMVNTEIETQDRAPRSVEGESPAVLDAVGEIIQRLKASKRPVLLVGAEVSRFKLKDKIVELAELLNIPVITSILGKSSFPESNKNFIGNYFGRFGDTGVREYVESADCILNIGAVLTEMETGGYTANLPPEKLIQIILRQATCGYKNYQGIDLKTFVESLLGQLKKEKNLPRFELPQITKEEIKGSASSENLMVADIIQQLNQFLTDDYVVASDVGDCLYAGLSLTTDTFIAPGYYSSMGFGVPAGIGAQIAQPEKRALVLVGDGAFQMTGLEMSTAAKQGMNPIIIVFNNAIYGMLRFIDQQREYYDLPKWDYAMLAKAVGGDGVVARTKEEFADALKNAKRSNKIFLIDAQIPQSDISPTLTRLTDHFGAKVRASI